MFPITVLTAAALFVDKLDISCKVQSALFSLRKTFDFTFTS